LRADGLEIVRYSPKERHIPHFAGEDVMIRFSKDPADWYGWTGENPVVGNLTQDLAQRGDAVGYWFWQAATDGLQTLPAGPGSAEIGGLGELPYDTMRGYLRRCRAYLYTGTQPAPYTLGLIEAMMTGTPVVSIGPKAYGGESYLAQTFEAHEFAGDHSDDPAEANWALGMYLSDGMVTGLTQARIESKRGRQRAIDLFGIDTVTEAWRAYLG
jgi:glycosyltransferase involved in cell wall biosynthesis